jgi:hypothetical protein
MPRSKANRVSTVVVRAVGKGGKKARNRKKPGTKGMAASNTVGCDCTLEYFKSLVDPFEFGDIKLGWGCMVPTASPQAFFRGTVVSGTDGSLTIAVLPSVFGGILLWNTAVGTVGTTSANNFGNQTAITANCGEGRCVSIGVRAFPNIALTSVPGSVYSGATVATTFTQLNTLATSDFIQLPTSHQSLGIAGGSSTGRPVDPESFIFYNFIVDGIGLTNTASGNTTRSIPFSVPYLSFVGLPASTTVYYEVVMNVEATQVVAHSGQTILADAASIKGESVGDYWPVPETLHRLLGPYLPHPGRPGEAAASKDVGFLQAMWSGLKRVAPAVGAALLKASFNYATGSSPAMQLAGKGGISGQSYGGQYRGYLQ